MKAAMRVIGLLLVNASELEMECSDCEVMAREIKVRIASYGITEENAMALAEVINHFATKKKERL